ncbi:HIG1 domain family member 2A, mitochondrial [Andrena cerasifolii]|uniref:HIG1 domain family member 2A, mitochondrial n=1 Tax=Andrena cerasifolii TaxID=2819439 RepID=UPI0040380491
MSQDTTKASANMLNELDWVQIRDELHEYDAIEPFADKIVRKTKENPLVPIGTAATVTALVYGLWNLHRGNSQMQQYMMRARVGAQAFTILAMVAGFMITAGKK